MRLIDADVLLKDLKERCNVPDVIYVMQVIDEQPVAYAADKVVEQMQTESSRWEESGTEFEDKRELGVAEGYRRAIEIVKAGGLEHE